MYVILTKSIITYRIQNVIETQIYFYNCETRNS